MRASVTVSLSFAAQAYLPALRRFVCDADGRGGFGEISSVGVANATGPDARAEPHQATAANDPGGHHR